VKNTQSITFWNHIDVDIQVEILLTFNWKASLIAFYSDDQIRDGKYIIFFSGENLCEKESDWYNVFRVLAPPYNNSIITSIFHELVAFLANTTADNEVWHNRWAVLHLPDSMVHIAFVRSSPSDYDASYISCSVPCIGSL
jgi:hypothetical protein